ncbi:hypothetical protein CRM90_29850 [Mycobacterium sp. ENV421]|nr:hypothetical protein CRM90_29850 [Mycobacterium sp. ENV421]
MTIAAVSFEIEREGTTADRGTGRGHGADIFTGQFAVTERLSDVGSAHPAHFPNLPSFGVPNG